MRTLALLLLVVLSLLLVLKFFPSDEARGAPAADDEVFLGRPAAPADVESRQDDLPADEPAPARAEEWVTDEAPAAVLVDPPDPEPAEEREPQVQWDQRLEVALAGAVLHGTRNELEGAIAALGSSLPRERAALARAFHRSMAGDLERARLASQDVSSRATTDEERRLLELALGGRGAAPRPAAYAARREGPVARAMAIALHEREAARAFEDGSYPAAARGYSDVILATLDSPWRSARQDLLRWSTALHEAQARHRWDPRGEWPAEELTVEPGDSLVRIRLRYLEDHPNALMCTGLIEHANRLRSSTIHPGEVLRVPTAEVSVLVDLSERWVVYMHDGEVVYSWECAIGREGEETITGEFTAGVKIPEPPWMRVGHPSVPYGDPENPLGTHWITWMQDGRKTAYGFHGTWEPATLGTAASDGCIRLHNDNIAILFDILPQGAPFVVRD